MYVNDRKVINVLLKLIDRYFVCYDNPTKYHRQDDSISNYSSFADNFIKKYTRNGGNDFGVYKNYNLHFSSGDEWDEIILTNNQVPICYVVVQIGAGYPLLFIKTNKKYKVPKAWKRDEEREGYSYVLPY